MPIAFFRYSLEGAVHTVRPPIQPVVKPEPPEQDVDFPV
jgi:hypothetical protein